MQTVIFTLLAFIASSQINGAKLPQGIRVCKSSENECISKAATDSLKVLKDGNKELGYAKLDPLFVKNIHIPGNGGKVDIEQNYDDMYVHGLSDSKFVNVKPNLQGENCALHVDTLTPSVQLLSKYKLVGKLLLFTLNGFGKSNITLLNVKASHDLKCEKYTKNGNEFVKFTDFKLDMKPEKLFYDFPNVIDGNSELSSEVNKVVNENDMEIFKELKRDFDKTFASIFMQLINKMFAKIPHNEIFLN